MSLSECYFYRCTSFRRATFFGGADFSGTHFHMFTYFNDAEFFANGEFQSAKFLHEEKSEFAGAIFHEPANFESSLFKGPMSFANAKFLKTANFANAKFIWKGSNFFEGPISFVNCIFDNQTSFEGVEFRHFAPLFFDAKLNEGTVWKTTFRWPLPKTPADADSFLRAYQCLKSEMDRVKKHEDELDFFSLELKCKRISLGAFKGLPIDLYGWLCDYGRSYARPLLWLGLSILIGVVPLWIHLGDMHWARSLTVSVANTFSILGVRRDFVDANFLQKLPGLVRAFGALQSVLGIVLLFCFGLAVKNRFRLK